MKKVDNFKAWALLSFCKMQPRAENNASQFVAEVLSY